METVVRVTVIYLFIIAGLRVMGKRELSEMSPPEFVALLLVAEITQQALLREDFSVTNALVGVATLFSLVFVISVFAHRSKRFQKVVEDSPTLLVRRGKILAENMNKERISPDDLYSEMHKSGLEELSQVKWAILEEDGKISFIPVDPKEKGMGDPAKNERRAG